MKSEDTNHEVVAIAPPVEATDEILEVLRLWRSDILEDILIAIQSNTYINHSYQIAHNHLLTMR